tara:strand:+ start:1315 stop:1752 length:438 start_codon:yes stop_codon:yes gene_type:complete
MATAEKFIKRALIKAGVRKAESPITADEIQDGLEQFNDMMIAMESSLNLGFVTLENATDIVSIPREAHAYVKAALALYLTPEYARVASTVLTGEASNMYDALLNGTVHIPDVSYPSTLPLGSGNVNSDLDVFDARFFPADKQSNF